MSSRPLMMLAAVSWWVAFALTEAPGRAQAGAVAARPHPPEMFQTATECVACHNGLTTPSGEDVSIGVSWRSSMMANSGRDPYWMASVRRETLDHPTQRAAIEDECSICHMPMARASAVAAGRQGEIFAHLPGSEKRGADARLAADGVSCTLCHQIGAERLGTPESFTGRFALTAAVAGERRMLGPYEVGAGQIAVMRSATGFRPADAAHLRSSDLCATCHTLITEARGANGEIVGRLPEQVPYQEWQHSALRSEKTCQECHMPPVEHPTPVTSVFGEPRDRMGRHTFIGGNFFMLRLLNRYRADLEVQALAQELEASARATVRQLQLDTATVAIPRAELVDGTLTLDVQVVNRTGHKLPTGYPARRAWLHLSVRDRQGRTVFESGAMAPTGAIQGNDGDADGTTFEPHHQVISAPDDVQVYEAVMGDVSGVPTTGLLRGVRFLKDNRLLPRGFDKLTAGDDVAVRGAAVQDADFSGEGDRVRYVVMVAGASGPFDVTCELLYQPIAFRWAQNLAHYDAPEPRRFVSYYTATAAASSVVLAHQSARVN